MTVTYKTMGTPLRARAFPCHVAVHLTTPSIFHHPFSPTKPQGLREKKGALPRRTAARGRLAAARIDTIIRALAQELPPRLGGSSGGSDSSDAGRLGDFGGVEEGNGVMLSASAIDDVIAFLDMDESGEIDFKVIHIDAFSVFSAKSLRR